MFFVQVLQMIVHWGYFGPDLTRVSLDGFVCGLSQGKLLLESLLKLWNYIGFECIFNGTMVIELEGDLNTIMERLQFYNFI